jgi:DNA-binding NarL/FixJ family response regulator
MIAEGRLLTEIASCLRIRYRTVRFHKVEIMAELEVTTDAELVQYALKNGLVSSVL